MLSGANRIRRITIDTLIAITHRECLQKHAETILKKCHLADVRTVLYPPPPCPQVSAFDHTPSPRLCGRPLWMAPYQSLLAFMKYYTVQVTLCNAYCNVCICTRQIDVLRAVVHPSICLPVSIFVCVHFCIYLWWLGGKFGVLRLDDRRF